MIFLLENFLDHLLRALLVVPLLVTGLVVATTLSIYMWDVQKQQQTTEILDHQ